MTKKEPLFHIVRRTNISLKKNILFKTSAILISLLLCCLLMLIVAGANPFSVIVELFLGNFGTQRRFWVVLRDTALLLIVALGLVPSFKMRFWNLGGNGQILMGVLASVFCMYYMGKANVPNPLIILTMIVSSISISIIWALIPAIFKALFNTNESLFTLMLNYIAITMVSIFLALTVKNGSGSLDIVKTGNLPNIGNNYMLTIIVSILLLVFMFCYLKYSKHGYELSVVGESEKTAKYIGINVKKVIIRTLILSGAVAGIAGLLIGGSIDHSITTESAKNLGFTAIMVAWLAKFNPLYMVGTSFLISFLTRGMSQVQSSFDLTNNSVTYIILGLMYFMIIGVDFFVNYKIIFRSKKRGEQ